MYLNRCEFLGRISSQPESRYTPSKKHVVNFSIAIPKVNKDDGVDYIDVAAWGRTADYVEKYLRKGDLIVVSGSYEQQHWEDKDGKKHSKPLLNFAQVHFSQTAKSNSNEYGVAGNTFTQVYDDEAESGLPF